LKLSGKAGNSVKTYSYDNLRFPLRQEDNDYLPRLWATRRVGWLMEQVRTNGEQKELRDEIVDLGTRYGIVTPYTSYLALEGRETTSLDVVNRPSSQPMPRRAGVGGGMGNLSADKAAAPSQVVTVTSGQAAVQESVRVREQKEVLRVKDVDNDSPVKRIGGKTFYLQNGVWTDSEWKADAKLPETTLSFGSDAYFDLLKQKPKLAEYFSLGEQVVVVFEGKVYRVNASAP
jgi:Ca-activated chloride channel family protein